MKQRILSLEDDSQISEINILPDGRVCLFGASRRILEIMDAIPLGAPELKERIERLRTTDVRQADEKATCRGGSTTATPTRSLLRTEQRDH